LTEASLIVPWRSTPSREPVWAWLRQYWKHALPEFERFEGHDDGVPFSKPVAANSAARMATGEVLVIIDADMLIDADIVRQAVEDVSSGATPWTTPLDRATRLKELDTRMVLLSDPTFPNWPGGGPKGRMHPWKHGAMIIVCRREDFFRIGGFDERFRGQTTDDVGLAKSLDCLVGEQVPPRKGSHGWHLYYDVAKLNGAVVWEGQTERPSGLTWKYLGAAKKCVEGDKSAMIKLMEERLAYNA
jgi:hypothetical protein